MCLTFVTKHGLIINYAGVGFSMKLQQPSIILISEKKLVRASLNSTLQKAGFTDVRNTDSAEDALAVVEMRNADVIISEWMMTGMDGLELTRRIKVRDQAMHRYTAVILYSACDYAEEIVKAYDAGIHDFVAKPVNTTILAARIAAAARLCRMVNDQSKNRAEEALLTGRLKQKLVQDPETGLWNMQYLNHQLEGMLENSRSRHYLTTCALIGIDEFKRMSNSYGQAAGLELITGLADCVKRNLRPLDVVARVKGHSLAIAIQSSNTAFNDKALFGRILKSVNRQSIKTSAGNIAITVSVGVASTGSEAVDIKPETLIENCWEKMVQASANGGNRMVA